MEFITTLKTYLQDPTIEKLVIVVAGVLCILTLRRLVRSSLTRRVEDKTTRYRTRKIVQFASYVVLAIFIGAVYSDKLGGFTVAFGVADAARDAQVEHPLRPGELHGIPGDPRPHGELRGSTSARRRASRGPARHLWPRRRRRE